MTAFERVLVGAEVNDSAYSRSFPLPRTQNHRPLSRNRREGQNKYKDSTAIFYAYLAASANWIYRVQWPMTAGLTGLKFIIFCRTQSSKDGTDPCRSRWLSICLLPISSTSTHHELYFRLFAPSSPFHFHFLEPSILSNLFSATVPSGHEGATRGYIWSFVRE